MNTKYMLCTWIALSVIVMTGCSSVLVYNAYPTHFKSEEDIACSPCFYSLETDPKPNTRMLPKEIEGALGDEDKLTSMMGYLIILGDPKAKIIIDGQSRRIRHTKAYLKAQADMLDRGFKEEVIPGYLGYTTYKPNITNWAQVLENEYANQWLLFLKNYLETNELIAKLEKEEKELRASVSNSQLAVNSLNERLSRINSGIASADNQLQQINAWFSSSKFDGGVGYEPWVLFPKYKYHFNNDIFKPVYERSMENVSGRFATSNVENPYLDHETVVAMDLANKIILNPHAYFHKDIADTIRDANLSPLVLSSASRSILQQATLQASYRASWLNSMHALGLGVDISMNGTNYDVRNGSPTTQSTNNFKLLRMVMLKAGFVNPVGYSNHYERNHFVLAQYSPTELGGPNEQFDEMALTAKQLSYFRQFNNIGKKEAELQQTYVVKVRQQITVHGKNLSQLSKEIGEKTKQIEGRNLILNAKNEQLRVRRDEQRAEAQRRERVRRQRELERERELAAERAERMREIREQRERERMDREYRERMRREERQMHEWMREIERRDRERERMREMERRGGGLGGLA